MTNQMMTTKKSSSPPVSEAGQLAISLGHFFTQARTTSGQPVSEGMVLSALGILFASKANDDAHCQEIMRNLTMAVYSAYRMKVPV